MRSIVFAGASCSASGIKYEKIINDICSKINSPFTGKPLSTIPSDGLGGCSDRHDLQLNWKNDRDVNVEIKRKTAPDWVQARLCFESQVWRMKGTGSSVVARDIIDDILSDERVYDFPPPFINDTDDSMTYDDWVRVKHMYPDVYIPCPNDSIAKTYRAKGVHYIQLEHYGLYHTGEDVCDFGVPMFTCSQRLRVRCKRHGSRCKVTGNHIPTSVTAALRPTIKTLTKSPICIEEEFDNFVSALRREIGSQCVLTRAAHARVLDGRPPYETKRRLGKKLDIKTNM